MKKLFSLLLALMATTCLLAEDFSVDGIYYDYLDGNNVVVTYRGDDAYSYDNEYSGAVTIPASVTYNGTTYRVTSIGSSAFYYCRSLTSITIPNSVTSIGWDAFSGCFFLTSITIPNSVTSIGSSAFYDCISLTSITIPNSVTSIGVGAFYDCTSLTSITIPNSVTSIGEDAFYGCSALTSIIWNATNCADASSLEDAPFYAIRSQITSLTFDKEVEHIPAYLCYGMEKLTAITIPNSVTSIGYYAFGDCSSLASITIGNRVTSIGEAAFSGCYYLTSITIPESVTNIGNHAFYSCSSLTSVTIPNSVTSIGYSAFSYCSKLTSITIPESVTSIGNHAFSYCSKLTSITIPNSVTNIGYSAFYYCSKLTSITIPNSVTNIGYSTFSRCTSLTSITIPNSVTSIGNDAFSYCSKLTSITIPESVTSIGNHAFSRCTSLTSITIPNSVTNIGYSAFYDCISLTSITIPNSVTSIGSSTFENCSSLSSITIPNRVTSIGEDAFHSCSSLTSITCEATIPPTVGESAFEEVSKSIPIYVPCGCVKAYKAKSGWADFTNIQEPLAKYSIEVNVNDTIMGTAKVDRNSACGNQISATPNIGYHFVQWSDGNTDNPRTLELTQNTALTAEFAQSFSGQCGDNLYWNYDETTKTISITGSGNMYNYSVDTVPWLLLKEQIMEVTTSNTATSIGTSAFEGCIRLAELSLGTAMEYIAANAFANCRRLYEIYSYASLPPLAETSSFTNYNATLYVPCKHKQYYQSDMVFILFIKIECIGAESEPVVPDTVIVTPGTNDVTITWPTEDNAYHYVIEIKKDGVIFCTLTFNADGQLLNIAFAPSRSGSHPVTYAASTGNGLRFTVTSLDAATTYGYNVTTKDEEDNTLSTYSGEFTTKGGTTTDMDNIQSSITTCQKFLHNGQLLIIRDGKTYNVMGAEIQ